MTQQDQPIYRFSQSPIWELQRSYYEEQGIAAWQQEEVPQYITSNPTIALAYAEMIFGFMQDRARLGQVAEPVTIVELGAGSGQLAFHLLTELCELIAYAGLELSGFRYIMTDLAANNIGFWQQHSSFQRFIEQGVLDFAAFDAIRDTELKLGQSERVIQSGDLLQPLIIVANYFFDSIPQELIYVEENNIFTCEVALQFADGAEEWTSPADKLANIKLDYHYRRAAEYEQEAYRYHALIALYRHKLEDSHILFPEVGLDCLDRLGRLSQQGFVLLTADKGDHRLEQWEFAEPPKLITHGSFSLTANYHAIQARYEQQGAEVYFTSHHYSELNVGCLLMVTAPSSYASTRLAYRRFVERFGPDDFFSMKIWFDHQLEQLELRQILALWRLGGYDAQWLRQSAKRIMELLLDCCESEMDNLRIGIHAMWGAYYALDERYNLALDCAMLLYQMEFYEDALPFFQRSLEHGEPDSEVLYHLAICCYEIGQEEATIKYAKRTLSLDPEHEGALAFLALLDSGE